MEGRVGKGICSRAPAEAYIVQLELEFTRSRAAAEDHTHNDVRVGAWKGGNRKRELLPFGRDVERFLRRHEPEVLRKHHKPVCPRLAFGPETDLLLRREIRRLNHAGSGRKHYPGPRVCEAGKNFAAYVERTLASVRPA